VAAVETKEVDGMEDVVLVMCVEEWQVRGSEGERAVFGKLLDVLFIQKKHSDVVIVWPAGEKVVPGRSFE
jgi:hypothetical protein